MPLLHSSQHYVKDETTGKYILNPKLQVIFHALAGTFGQIFESFINHPLDTLKTRYQLISNVSINKTPSMFKMTLNIIYNEGIISIYRGLPMVLLMQAPRGFIKFGTNYSIQNIVYNTNQTIITNINILNCISGIGTGIIDGIIVSPFEFIKVRMQSLQYKQIYKNTFIALYDIMLKQKKPFLLLNGMELTLWRNGLWHGVYFGFLGKQKNASDRFCDNKFNDFIIGCIGGSIGSIFSSPFDCAKSRLQCNINNNIYRPWAIKYIYNIYKNEGILSLYRGFLPKLIRLGLGGGILMFSFEYALTFIEMVHLFSTRQV